MRRRFGGPIMLLLALAVCVATAADQRPERETRSENGAFVLQINPGRPGRGGRSCEAALSKQTERGRRGRTIWRRALVNDTAPAQVFVRDNGRFVVTLDEYEHGGVRNALVVYGAQGELLRHFLLQDLLRKGDWEHVKVARRDIDWLKDAKSGFDDEHDQFVIRLKWGREVRVDLKTLQLVDGEGKGLGGYLTTVPYEALVQLLGHLEKGGEDVIAQRLAELDPSEQDGTLPADEEAGEEVAAADEAAEMGEELPPDEELAVAEETLVDGVEGEEAAPEVAAADADMEEPAEAGQVDEESDFSLRDDDNVPTVEGRPIPEPDPVAKTDYLAWVNEIGKVNGPDAGPVYDSAIAQVVEDGVWTESGFDLSAAAAGDPAALASAEFEAWEEANAAALATFREASRYEAKGWELHSEDGGMMGVLLPNLRPMRTLAKGCVAEGRWLVQQGEMAAASDYYLDALAAGGHLGHDATLIGNLVGTAVQALAADALLDLNAEATADDLDFAQLATDVESTYKPVRSSAEGIQFERTFYMDTVQRFWDVDPDTGEYTLNKERVASAYSFMEDPDRSRLDSIMAALDEVGYDETIAQGQAYYDVLTEAVSQPYAEATQRVAELEAGLDDPGVSPAMRALLPALSRYHFINVRGEATRRASVLVTNLQAYHQAHGEYPASLEVFGGRDYAVDPFSDAGFVYFRDGDDFVLYSAGGNTIDDGGVHDPRGDTQDLVFWPRPPKE